MSKGYAQIHLKKVRGVLEVQGFGQTPRGSKFLKKSVPLTSKSPGNEKFKGELLSAVEELLS